jgi:hypothetical protein
MCRGWQGACQICVPWSDGASRRNKHDAKAEEHFRNTYVVLHVWWF